jgi:hypothetical protein
MKATDFDFIKQNGHLPALLELGLNEKDVHLLYSLEELANKFFVLCCEINVSEAEINHNIERWQKRLAKYFNLEVEEAKKIFRFNKDGRVYTLKIREDFTEHNLVIRDMGGDYILCPKAPRDWKPTAVKTDGRSIVVRDDIVL